MTLVRHVPDCTQSQALFSKGHTIASIWLRKYARIFVLGHYLFLETHSFPRASLSENCSLLRTDNVREQISEHIFAPNEGYCLFVFNLLIRQGDVKFVGDKYNRENVNSPFQKVLPTEVLLKLVEKLEQLKYKTKKREWNPYIEIFWDQY